MAVHVSNTCEGCAGCHEDDMMAAVAFLACDAAHAIAEFKEESIPWVYVAYIDYSVTMLRRSYGVC